METLMIIVAGILVSISTYLMLSKNFIKVILSMSLLTHASHLLLMALGGFQGSVPIIDEHTTEYIDALPQALILTSIVISFGVTAFILVLAYRTYESFQTDQLNVLWGLRDE